MNDEQFTEKADTVADRYTQRGLSAQVVAAWIIARAMMAIAGSIRELASVLRTKVTWR